MDRERILKILKKSPDHPLTLKEIGTRAGIDKKSREALRHQLEEIVREGGIRRSKAGGYQLAGESKQLPDGILYPHRDGYGFVKIEGEDDVFIPARYMYGGMPGDRVRLEIEPRRGDGKREGRIASIVERGTTRFTGRFEKSKRGGVVISDDDRIRMPLFIQASKTGIAKDGDIVVAEITSYPDGKYPGEGSISKVLGRHDDPEVDILSVMEKYSIPSEFPPSCMKEAQTAPANVTDADFAQREDLRQKLFITIDGETAKDFDDAVFIEVVPAGYTLYVSIADVSHYVKPASPLDKEAYVRGTSVYFPDRCIPMLPHELSNGICSLNPNVDRLTLTAEMSFDTAGDSVGNRFYTSVIKSARRCTYTEVHELLEDKAGVEGFSDELTEILHKMHELALILMQKRRERGSIDFDLPEPEIRFGADGSIVNIEKSERNIAHRIIEEFMLSANEAVARYVTAKGLPFIYRIHENPSPEKVSAFGEMVSLLGYVFEDSPDSVNPQTFQRIIKEVSGKPEERLINETMLRCMKQARYSEINLSHFGLASDCYTHFTSPIRRYPDLIVHRILKSVINTGRSLITESYLGEASGETSRRERSAMEAEREIVNLNKAQFMKEKTGEEFEGIISSVTGFGFYVELNEYFVEGLVHAATLPQDFYRFDEKSFALVAEREKTAYRIGDSVRIRVAAVSVEKRQLDFALLEHEKRVIPTASARNEDYKRVPVAGRKPKGWKSGTASDSKKRSDKKHPDSSKKKSSKHRGKR